MRVLNRIAGALLGLVLLAAGLAVVVGAVLVLTGRRPWPLPLDRWFARLAQTSVGDPQVFWTCSASGWSGC